MGNWRREKVCSVSFSMAAEENNTVTMEKKIHGGDKFSGAGTYACGFSSPVVVGDVSTMPNLAGRSSYDGKDSFYEKLNKLNESSGLSIVFNLRQTTLDLHLFYEEVIKRGGFNQVTMDAKWGEVACTLHVKSNITMFPTQLQKVYENLLLQFEQLYYYRSRKKGTMQPPSQVSDAARLEPVKGSGDRSDDSAGKRKFCDRSSPVVAQKRSDNRDGPIKKKKYKNDCCLVSTVGPETLKSQTSSTNTYLKKDRRAPVRTRSSYQIYLKLECERIKKVHGESYGAKKFRDMVIDSWRTLSENDKEPYIEASKLDKERYNREMAAYKQPKNKETAKDENLHHNGSAPSMINFGAPSGIDNGYYVTSQADTGSNIVPDASFIESTVQIVKNTKPSEPIFQMDWGYFA